MNAEWLGDYNWVRCAVVGQSVWFLDSRAAPRTGLGWYQSLDYGEAHAQYLSLRATLPPTLGSAWLSIRPEHAK